MKKILYSIIALSVVFSTMSCQKEITEPSSENNGGYNICARLTETKVTYIETEVGGKIVYRPSWQIGDAVVGLKGTNTPIKFTVVNIDDRGVAVLHTDSEIQPGDQMSLLYAPSAPEPVGITDGKIPVDVAVMSDDPSKISPIMMAQGNIAPEGEETYLDFTNKMAIIAIKSVTGLTKGSIVHRMVILGSRTFSTAQVDLLKQTVEGLYFGDLRTNITSDNAIVDGKFEHTVYASIVPAETTIDIYTVTDQQIYKSQIKSREMKASHYYYTSNRPAVLADDVYQTGPNEYSLFSPANLNYVVNEGGVKDRWEFAEHQTDFIGDINNDYNANLKNYAYFLPQNNPVGTMDLFSWSDDTDLYRMNLSVWLWNETISRGELYDWGNGIIAKHVKDSVDQVHPTFVGYWVPGFWHTPTPSEWDYMFFRREGSRYCYCTVSDMNECGVVVFNGERSRDPQTEKDWNKVNASFANPYIPGQVDPAHPTFEDNYRTRSFFNSSDYIFLPATGFRTTTGSKNAGYYATVTRSQKDLLYWAYGTPAWTTVGSAQVYCGPAMNVSFWIINSSHKSNAAEGIAVRMIHVI